MAWKPVDSNKIARGNDAIAKIQVSVRRDMQRFKGSSCAPMNTMFPSRCSKPRLPSRKATTSRIPLTTIPTGSATKHLIITTLEPSTVAAWKLAFYNLLEAHPHSNQLIDNISEIHYRAFKPKDSATEMVKVLATCASVAGAAFVMAELSDFEVAEAVLSPQFVIKVTKVVVGGRKPAK